MRRLLLATVALAPLLSPCPSFAAGIPVVDTASIAARAMEAAKSLTEAKATVSQLQSSYRQLVSTYNSITGARNFEGLAGALGGLTRTYLPEAGQIAEATHGTTGGIGRGEEIMQRNRLYAPAERDEWAVEMERREYATANAQSLAMDGIADAQDRLSKLDDMKAALENAQDIREVQGITGIIQTEAQNLNLHNTQMAQIQGLLAAEDRVERQRASQKVRQDLDDWLEKLRIQGGE
jgi:conjugal transfer/entry exclusion protein